MPAPMTLTAPSISISRTRSPKRFGQLRAKAILFVQILARDHHGQRAVGEVELFAGDAVIVKKREDVAGSLGPAISTEDQHVALAGDAGDRAGQARGGRRAGRPCRRPMDPPGSGDDVARA